MHIWEHYHKIAWSHSCVTAATSLSFPTVPAVCSAYRRRLCPIAQLPDGRVVPDHYELGVAAKPKPKRAVPSADQLLPASALYWQNMADMQPAADTQTQDPDATAVRVRASLPQVLVRLSKPRPRTYKET